MVATTALLKRETHLTFLSGEHVIFTLFDTKLTGEERQKIAGRLLSLLELWEPGTMLKDVMTVPHPNFCNSDTFWPVSPNNLQLERPSLTTFVTTRSFLL